jgi:hypothetical protein
MHFSRLPSFPQISRNWYRILTILFIYRAQPAPGGNQHQVA